MEDRISRLPSGNADVLAELPLEILAPDLTGRSVADRSRGAALGIARTPIGWYAAPIVPTTSIPPPTSVKMRIGTNPSRNFANRSIPAADHDGDIVP